MKKTDAAKVISAVGIAAVLWFFMFSPLTAGLTNFWLTMSFSACVLTFTALCLSKGDLSGLRCQKPMFQIVTGILIAFALWGVFWIGDRLSRLMFDFARDQVNTIYSMKDSFPAWAIALLLLLVIGPAEEFFWRGFVQKTLTESFSGRRYNKDLAFLVTTLLYSLVHVPSMNFMLIMAAMVAGAVWGFIYRLNPKLLPALIVSHALWDALVFVIIPI